MSAYAELTVTTNFSFLRGASDPEELVGRAHELGLAGLGIADRNSVAGVVRAHSKARTIAEGGGGLKLAVGARLVFADGTPDILAYPADRAAWGRLTQLLTVGKSRAEKGDCILYRDDLIEHIEGLNLIVLPGAVISRRAGVATGAATSFPGGLSAGGAPRRVSNSQPPPSPTLPHRRAAERSEGPARLTYGCSRWQLALRARQHERGGGSTPRLQQRQPLI
jgi:error-prone DNA polymerase